MYELNYTYEIPLIPYLSHYITKFHPYFFGYYCEITKLCPDFHLLQYYHNITYSEKNKKIDPKSLNNYRPISILHLLSKILERIVSEQLRPY